MQKGHPKKKTGIRAQEGADGMLDSQKRTCAESLEEVNDTAKGEKQSSIAHLISTRGKKERRCGAWRA